MARLDIERQNNLEPKRVKYAIEQLEALGFEIFRAGDTKVHFQFKGHTVSLFPYSGWHSGKSIKDGRGIENLLKQLKNHKI